MRIQRKQQIGSQRIQDHIRYEQEQITQRYPCYEMRIPELPRELEPIMQKKINYDIQNVERNPESGYDIYFKEPTPIEFINECVESAKEQFKQPVLDQDQILSHGKNGQYQHLLQQLPSPSQNKKLERQLTPQKKLRKILYPTCLNSLYSEGKPQVNQQLQDSLNKMKTPLLPKLPQINIPPSTFPKNIPIIKKKSVADLSQKLWDAFVNPNRINEEKEEEEMTRSQGQREGMKKGDISEYQPKIKNVHLSCQTTPKRHKITQNNRKLSCLQIKYDNMNDSPLNIRSKSHTPLCLKSKDILNEPNQFSSNRLYRQKSIFPSNENNKSVDIRDLQTLKIQNSVKLPQISSMTDPTSKMSINGQDCLRGKLNLNETNSVINSQQKNLSQKDRVEYSQISPFNAPPDLGGSEELSQKHPENMLKDQINSSEYRFLRNLPDELVRRIKGEIEERSMLSPEEIIQRGEDSNFLKYLKRGKGRRRNKSSIPPRDDLYPFKDMSSQQTPDQEKFSKKLIFPELLQKQKVAMKSEADESVQTDRFEFNEEEVDEALLQKNNSYEYPLKEDMEITKDELNKARIQLYWQARYTRDSHENKIHSRAFSVIQSHKIKHTESNSLFLSQSKNRSQQQSIMISCDLNNQSQEEMIETEQSEKKIPVEPVEIKKPPPQSFNKHIQILNSIRNRQQHIAEQIEETNQNYNNGLHRIIETQSKILNNIGTSKAAQKHLHTKFHSILQFYQRIVK